MRFYEVRQIRVIFGLLWVIYLVVWLFLGILWNFYTSDGFLVCCVFFVRVFRLHIYQFIIEKWLMNEKMKALVKSKFLPNILQFSLDSQFYFLTSLKSWNFTFFPITSYYMPFNFALARHHSMNVIFGPHFDGLKYLLYFEL